MLKFEVYKKILSSSKAETAASHPYAKVKKKEHPYATVKKPQAPPVPSTSAGAAGGSQPVALPADHEVNFHPLGAAATSASVQPIADGQQGLSHPAMLITSSVSQNLERLTKIYRASVVQWSPGDDDDTACVNEGPMGSQQM